MTCRHCKSFESLMNIHKKGKDYTIGLCTEEFSEYFYVMISADHDGCICFEDKIKAEKELPYVYTTITSSKK